MSNNSKENNFLQPQNAQPLYSKKNWVNWKLKQKEDGTWTKVPYKPNNYKASHSNPDTWSPIEKVVAKVKNFSGIGIVFDGTFFGIDLDKILVNGKVVDEPSQELLKKVNTYVETSPSGTGLHILFELSEPFELLRNKYNTGRKSESGEIKYECYNTERFFTFTGKEFEGSKPIRKSAGEVTCFECGGDGDWTKFHPEPEILTEPLKYMDYKGTGKVLISIS
jgi:primase-polymerase (primpol)-like protein